MLETALTRPNGSIGSDPAFALWQGAARTAQMRLDPHGRTAGPIPTFSAMLQNPAAINGHYLVPEGENQASTAHDAAFTSIGGQKTADQDSDYSFADVIDMVNPLQHLPVIGTIYRKVTGDAIKPVSNIVGGAIFGGPVGAVASTVNAILKDRTGRDLGENALALVGFDVTPNAAPRPDLKPDATTETAAEEISRTAFAFAGSAYTQGGKRNFAASGDISMRQSWNA
jgi:hypothetical protein